ncbi:DMT family transporter [Roseitranquillus sediminis]|uniref:DMT family transporter n=1 Tax=Roseitranquillus sediminis TaxID=2809051 RepID=UPI001D0CDC71|nr:DMT family transporter [Roseitranquillus sediminis]MBM9594269.1 DMT family transporter [Roseitranquillus sediminis]
MGLVEWSLLLALSVIWGGSFFFVAVAVEEIPVLTIVAGRVALAAAGLWVVLAASGRRVPHRTWGACLVMGLVNNALPFALIVWGQSHLASGVAAILNATTPLFGVIVAHLGTSDERISFGRLAGVLTGLAGVAVMVGGAALGDLDSAVWAQIAILGAALCYAIAGVFGRRFARLGVAPMQIATGQVTASTLMLVPLALMLDQPWRLSPSLAATASVLGLALVCTALAYVIYFRILAASGAVNILLVTFLVPVTAILLGTVLLDETLVPRHLVGLAAIAIGLALIDGRLLRWPRAGRSRISG